MKEKLKLQRIRMLSALGDFQLALSAADFLQEADEKRPTVTSNFGDSDATNTPQSFPTLDRFRSRRAGYRN